MNKSRLLLILLILMAVGYAANQINFDVKGSTTLSENINDFKVYLANLKLNGMDIEGINKTADGFVLNNVNGDISVDIINDSTEYDVESYLQCDNVTADDINTTTIFDTVSSLSIDSSKNINYNVLASVANTNGVYKLDGFDNIYFYRGDVDNNLIFNNMCWKIVRTTETNGVKILYNGLPDNGKCNNTGADTEIGKSAYNDKDNHNAYVGYMYGKESTDALLAHENINDSAIKKTIDNWFEKNMNNVIQYLDDEPYYCDRTIATNSSNNVLGADYSNAGGGQGLTAYSSSSRSSYYTKTLYPSLEIEAPRDSFTIQPEKGNGNLNFPVGLLTSDEIVLAGYNSYNSNTSNYKTSKIYLYTGEIWWSMTPAAFLSGNKAAVNLLSTDYLSAGVSSQKYGVRPVVTLNKNISVKGGDGKANSPYVIDTDSVKKVSFSLENKIIGSQEKANELIKGKITLNLTCKLIVNKLSRNNKKTYSNGKSWDFDYRGIGESFIVPVDGTYKIEAWGAQGGSYFTAIGGLGAYTTGDIDLLEGQKLHIFVGSKGHVDTTKSLPTEFNGGGKAGHQNSNYTNIRFWGTGGGASDIRLVDGIWDDFNSLKSRIMVAAGGGGSFFAYQPNALIESGSANGGYGGSLLGGDGTTANKQWASWGAGGSGGTQTSGGYDPGSGSSNVPYGVYSKGGFGFGGNSDRAASGGGSGYYGGGGSRHVQSSGGGSSFVSGYSGCDAISDVSTPSSIIHTGKDEHYSGFVFKNSKMIAGNETMPTHDGTTTTIGNSGNGYVKITLLNKNSA